MFLDPNQTTLAQLSLISQMAALERTGQLSGAECGIDFNALYQNTVELAVRAGSRVPPLSFVEAQPLDPETFTQSLCGFFRTKLSFDPAQDAFFSPRQILVQQGDSIVPMIIDKTDVRAALAATEGPAQDEIRKFEEV